MSNSSLKGYAKAPQALTTVWVDAGMEGFVVEKGRKLRENRILSEEDIVEVLVYSLVEVAEDRGIRDKAVVQRAAEWFVNEVRQPVVLGVTNLPWLDEVEVG